MEGGSLPNENLTTKHGDALFITITWRLLIKNSTRYDIVSVTDRFVTRFGMLDTLVSRLASKFMPQGLALASCGVICGCSSQICIQAGSNSPCASRGPAYYIRLCDTITGAECGRGWCNTSSCCQ